MYDIFIFNIIGRACGFGLLLRNMKHKNTEKSVCIMGARLFALNIRIIR